MAVLLAGQAAALEVFTDRSLWEAALHGTPSLADFEGDAPGYHMTPYETSEGVMLDSMNDPITLGIVEDNWLNNSQGLHYRDFGEQLLWVLPGGSALHAFGFDYDTDDNDWEVRVRGVPFVLEDNTEGFFGVVDREYSLASFITTCTAAAQGGLLVDNLAYTDQVWGDLLVFTDRDAWEDHAAPPFMGEDFEMDAPGTYDLPYATGHGFALNWLVGPIEIQILDMYMNPTQGLHYRDFSHQMEWRFPGGASTAAFGFDYDADDNMWELQVAGETIYLQPNAVGFIGVVHTTGALDHFVTTCTAWVQGGLSVDNLAYASGTTGVEETSFSRIKQLY